MHCFESNRLCQGVYYTSAKDLVFDKAPNPAHGPFVIIGDAREKQLSYLLRTTTISQTTGSFEQTFWSRDVLLAAWMSPKIWYAANAFAAMHHRMRLVASSNPSDRYISMEYYITALTQYNKAIQHLIQLTSQNSISYQDKDIILLASALFTGICCLYRNMKQAVIHIKNAVRLLSEWQFTKLAQAKNQHQRQTLLTANSLFNLIATLQYQMLDGAAASDTGVQQPQLVMPFPTAEANPAPFRSTSEAYMIFMRITFSLDDLRPYYRSEKTIPMNNTVVAWIAWQNNLTRHKFAFYKRCNDVTASHADRVALSTEADDIELLELLGRTYQAALESNQSKYAK